MERRLEHSGDDFGGGGSQGPFRPSHRPPGPPSHRPGQLRVLVIDDSEIARAVIGRLLRDAGHQVFEMVSAIGATRVVSAEDVHVVIVDLMMPALTGDKLVALFRRNPRWKDLALVIVSDSPGDELESLYQSVGADAGISKRDIPQQLVPTVERLARRAR